LFASLARGRDNNFQLIRLIAAALVIVSHSFPISGVAEPHFYGVTLGTIAVWAFFALSGFLIFKSFERQPLWAFAEARVLRIYPALIVVTVLTVLVLGPLVTTASNYFAAKDTWEYIPRALSLKFVSFALPGVFTSNPTPGVNGPLWTLYYEVICYAALVVGLTLFRSFRLFVLVYAAVFYLLRDTLYADLSLAFVSGMAVYRYRQVIPAHPVLALGLLSAAWIAPPIAPVVVGYTVLWLAQLKGPQLAYNRLGDYSYGLYIYGWPVQQTLTQLLPGIGPFGLIATALPVGLGCAFLSWTVVERPSLLLKGTPLRILERRKVQHLPSR
jgi:peptidoglycan/LPS O-acetylase OafA/YrhL